MKIIKTEGTKESIINASSDYLTDYLPDNYDTWTKEKLYKYLENNSWEPFENYSGEEIWEWIEDKAVWIDTNNKPTKEKMKKLINDLSCEVAYLLDNPTNGSVYMVEEEVIETIQDLVTKLENEIKGESK